MKKLNVLLKISCVLLLVCISFTIGAQEIGRSWEFNTDGDLEGIQLSSSLTNASVEGGYLKATVATKNPSLSSGTFALNAADYGFVQIRLKMQGATKGQFLWNYDSGSWGISNFTLESDTDFQIVNIPVFLNDEWKGTITRVMRLSFDPAVGSQVVIDYIRIMHGYFPQILEFIPHRTVFLKQAPIPLFATIENPGDAEGHLYSKLILPEGAELVSGSLENDNGLLFNTVDTTMWSVSFDSVGVYDVRLMVFTDRDTVEQTISLTVTDKAWKQKDFLLSAWSPPYAWYGPPYLDTVFEYYKNANFDNLLWVRDDDALMAKVHQFGFKYFLDVFSIIGNEYLRAPDKVVPPEIPEEKLQILDQQVEKYKDDPALLGYFICDEPEEEAFENIRTVIARIRKIDPEKLEFVNLYGYHDWSEEYVEKFLQTTGIQLLSYDHYIFKNDKDGKYYFKNLEFFRKYALTYGIPFCNIIQAIGTNGTSQSENLNWRTPTDGEHRWLVYSSLTYGVHALVWFHWHSEWGVTGNPDRDTVYPSIQNLNLEIDSLSQIMVHLKTTGVYHVIPEEKEDEKPLPPDGMVQTVTGDSNLVVGYFTDDNRNDYFMLMNKNYSDSADVTIYLNGVANELKYFDVGDDQWKNVPLDNDSSMTVFDVHLRPGGGKLFSVSWLITGILPQKIKNRTGDVLRQNYPNPFDQRTTIEYVIKPLPDGSLTPQKADLRVYDPFGKEVAVLVNGFRIPGEHKVIFSAGKLSPGIYFYKLTAGGQVIVRKMLLMK